MRRSFSVLLFVHGLIPNGVDIERARWLAAAAPPHPWLDDSGAGLLVDAGGMRGIADAILAQIDDPLRPGKRVEQSGWPKPSQVMTRRSTAYPRCDAIAFEAGAIKPCGQRARGCLPVVTIISIGENETRIWGMTNRQRTVRIAASLPEAEVERAAGRHLIANDAYVFDPLLFQHMLDRSEGVICKDGVPILAATTTAGQRRHVEEAMRADRPIDDPTLARIDVDEAFTLYNRKLRKRERPLLMRLQPATVRAVERATYLTAYKGVTDVLTKYLWPEWALVLTRIAAALGMSPNMVTAIGIANCVAATICFWNGDYWLGMALALIFMVLDTVDGKLARCTLTSSRLGNVLDHGVDKVHPPFWWWAWAHGLGAWGLALSPRLFAVTMIAIIGGYFLQRMIETYFVRRYRFHIHVWAKIDSDFRLITARRNPNMVILFVATLFQRPDIGIVAVAVWTVLSLIFHAVRLVQVRRRERSGAVQQSWLS